MKKINCSNVFCIMTKENRSWQSRMKYLKQNSYNEIIKDGGVFVFCEGSKGKNYKLEEKTEKSVYCLKVPFEERYSELAEKTFLSIKYITKSFDFNFFLKCDDTKPLNYNLLKEPLLEDRDFFGLSCDRVRKTRGGFQSIKNLHVGLKATKKRNFIKWASKRNLKVNPEYWDEQVWYANWKPYAMSSRFCRVLTDYAENYVNMYNLHLAGCEDHMVAKILKDLKIAFSLK